MNHIRCVLLPAALALELVCCVHGIAGETEERIWLEATINGKSAKLIFDTGSSHLTLFPKGAARLGISFEKPPRNLYVGQGEIPTGITEECDLTIGCTRLRTAFRVPELPAILPLAADGLVGWEPVRNNIVLIDAVRGVLTCLSNVSVETTMWTKLKLATNDNVLRLQWASSGGQTYNIAIDTGDHRGVKLAPERWRSWNVAHANEPKTLAAYYDVYAGLVVAEEAWARELSFGLFSLSDLPVSEADKTGVALGGAGYQATLGLWALKRVEIIIDGKQGIAYLRPRKTLPPPYEHNRLGAVFTPADLRGNDELIAHVVLNSPAYEAGIRSGDVRLRIDRLDVTKWRTDPAVLPLSRFWEQPAGTELLLILKRGGRKMEVKVVLQQILPTGVVGKAQSRGQANQPRE